MLFILNKKGKFCKHVIKLCSYNLLGLFASFYMNSVRSLVIYVLSSGYYSVCTKTLSK